MSVFKGNNKAELKERRLAFDQCRMYIVWEETEILIADLKQAIR